MKELSLKYQKDISKQIDYQCRNITPQELKEDCKQEAWFCCLEIMENYDPVKGKVTTFFRYPIRKAIDRILRKVKQQQRIQEKLQKEVIYE